MLVHIRLAMVCPAPGPSRGGRDGAPSWSRAPPVRFDGEWVETPVLRGEPAAGAEAAGPAIFELPEATFVVPPGWRAEVDDAGHECNALRSKHRKTLHRTGRAGSGHPAGDDRRPARRLRRDGRGR